MRLHRLIGAVAMTVVMVAPGTADAYYGNGAQIISADFGRLEQGDDGTTFAAISSNGSFVAFQTRARNLFPDGDADPPGQYREGGIFRSDVASRGLELVADGDFRDEETNTLQTRGAQNPSISADGRYVAFSTAQRLVAQDTNQNIDVYVRDMAVPIRNLGAFDLVSAKDGGDVPASYGPQDSPPPGGAAGSEVTRGAAISADGQRVAFRVTQPASDLPSRPAPDTPPSQVFVRDRGANTTELVTRRSDDGGPAGGALGPAGISGDGSTVIWTGTNAPSQTRLIGGENTEPSAFYYLWRRVADGPSAPTRRITGIADPDDPACPPGAQINFNQTSTGPCFGPLAEQEAVRANISSQLPGMSADGRRVIFLTGTGPRPNASTGPGLDAYLTDMSEGVTRKQGTLELTREGSLGDPATGSPVGGISTANGGRYVALTSVRTRFSLPTLRFTGRERSVPDARELYVVDLDARTIERVLRSVNGGDIDSDVANGATISGDGSRLAFTTSAGNLFFGDGNQRADAFMVTRQPEPGESPPPPPETGSGLGLIEDLGSDDGPIVTARARSLRNGSVEVLVRVPGAGGVKAEARSRVGKPRRQRSLAVRTTRARRAGRVRLVLRPVRRYRREVRRRSRVLSRISVGYVASRGGRRLRTSVRATFRKPAPAKRRQRRKPPRRTGNR